MQRIARARLAALVWMLCAAAAPAASGALCQAPPAPQSPTAESSAQIAEPAQAQAAPPASDAPAEPDARPGMSAEEFEAALQWQHGKIELGQQLAVLELDADFRFLDSAQSKRVLEDVWGNPPRAAPLGMIFPAEQGPTTENGWAIVVTYVEEGHVEDSDAAETDYDELLESMRQNTRASSAKRVADGYESIELVGWAAAPHYDAPAHKLYWARELVFGGAPEHVLNYDVRALGRRGVLSLNAVAAIERLHEVESGMQRVLGMVSFAPGQRYEDYDSGVDSLAGYGVGTLIAGTLAAKAGFFKLLLAGLLAAKKLVLIAVVALGGLIAKFFRRRKAASGA